VAKKGTAPKASVDDLVKNALRTVATTRGPMRLTGKGGDPPALFASASGANKDAIAILKADEKPLIAIDDSAITLTPAGFGRVADSIPEEQLGAAARAVATGMNAAERVEFLNDIVRRTPTATAELLPVLKDAEKQQKIDDEAEVAAARKRKEREEASLAALEEWKATVARVQARRVETLKQLFAAEGVAVPDPPRKPGAHEPPPEKPRTAEDRDFRRDVVERLVSAWLYHLRQNNQEVATAFERALRAISGVVRVGEAGNEVAFDGRIHECERGVSDGAPVRVVRPGWVFEDDRGPPIQRVLVERKG
jgi:hypothetical protein